MNGTKSHLGTSIRLAVVVLMLGFSNAARAAPYISSFPSVGFELSPIDSIGASELTTVYIVLQDSFASSMTTGDGSATVTAPSIVDYTNTSLGFFANATLTSNGLGTASVTFGMSVVATVTNTGPITQDYLLNSIYEVNTQVRADPAAGEELIYGWTIGSAFLHEDQFDVCDSATFDPYACNNFYDFNYDRRIISIDAGQSIDIPMFMNFNLSVAQIPEPSTLFLFTTVLIGMGAVLGVFTFRC